MKRALLVVVAVVFTCSVVPGAQAPVPLKDPSQGTWKVNLAKSTYSPGPAPKNAELRRYEVRPDGFTVYTGVNVDAQGNPVFNQAVYKTDGKDYPLYTQVTLAAFVTSGAKPSTTSVKVLDAYTVTVAQKDAKGVPAVPFTRVLSKDGKTMTQTSRGTNAQGQAVNNVIVYDRVN